MGQYYYPVNLDKEEYLYSHDYGNGLKLMEHSYIGNDFVETIEQLLTSSWKKTRIVWAGDYMDDGLFIEDSYNNLHKNNLHKHASQHFDKISPKFENFNVGRYLVNHSKKEFVDKGKMSRGDVHPLPLLTCSGNGRGGGDYHGRSRYVGSWAGDVISVEKEDLKLFIFKKNDYKEIKPNFRED